MSTLTLNHSAAIQSNISDLNVMTTLLLWMNRHAQRKQLAQLDNRQLLDIGLSQKEVLFEANLPFWK